MSKCIAKPRRVDAALFLKIQKRHFDFSFTFLSSYNKSLFHFFWWQLVNTSLRIITQTAIELHGTALERCQSALQSSTGVDAALLVSAARVKGTPQQCKALIELPIFFLICPSFPTTFLCVMRLNFFPAIFRFYIKRRCIFFTLNLPFPWSMFSLSQTSICSVFSSGF